MRVVHQRRLAEKVVLVQLHHPAQPSPKRCRERVGVLADDDVLLLQAQDALALQTEGEDAEVDARLQHRVPDVLGVRAWEMHLIAQLADEPNAQDDRGHARDLCLDQFQIRKSGGGDVDVSEARHELTRPWSRDVDGGVLRAHVDDARLQPPVRHPPLDPLVDGFGAAGGRGHKEVVFAEARDGAVIENHALVIEHRAVPDTPDLQIANAIGIDLLEQGYRLGASDLELAQRADVDDRHPFVNRLALLRRLAILPWAPPLPRPQELGAKVGVTVVKRAFLARLEVFGGE